MKILALLACALLACTPASSPVPSHSITQDEARAAVEGVAAAWKAGADLCVDMAVATEAGGPPDGGSHELVMCAAAFLPTHALIMSAANAVDAWDAAAQKNMPCLLKATADGLHQALPLVKLPATEQSVADRALAMVDALGASCK